jgi:hypothetical protein
MVTIRKKKKAIQIVDGFDAIKTMRKIRDKVSLEIMNLTYEEELRYLSKQNKK